MCYIAKAMGHGTWSSDCVWQYIQSNHLSGENIASVLASTINDAL